MVLFCSNLTRLASAVFDDLSGDFQLLVSAMTKTIDQKSLTSPTNCMYVQLAMEPTNFNRRLFRALDKKPTRRFTPTLHAQLPSNAESVCRHMESPPVSSETTKFSLNPPKLLRINQSSVNFYAITRMLNFRSGHSICTPHCPPLALNQTDRKLFNSPRHVQDGATAQYWRRTFQN